ncbi:hypothetical protein LY474_25990 [Myxococcus stipitatus]|uniref:choice-of-anchor R domain-containing protein n=1 Tax=Myxococcus stipitatus TaxID=83455 RepID=UPI001F3661C2|nr:choice-of-anchor R domain-containing protein [Myxococcus stipitatus]MCE9671265.1 hypothetical protein [Myxococcus stipitatus]
MSDTRVGATLTYTGTAQSPSPAKYVQVDSAGLVLALDIPSGVTLSRASLAVHAPADDVVVDLAPSATLATSLGQSALVSTSEITWLSLDWGTRRPLTSVQLELTTPVPAGATWKGYLSVSEGGAWYPPTPSDTVAVGTAAPVPLPGIFAGRLMVEFVDGAAAPPPVGTPKTLTKARLSKARLHAPARPPDLTASVGVGAGALFFHQASPLLPLQKLVIEDTLTHSLQRAWPTELKAGKVDVTLRASGLGLFERVQLVLETLDVVQRWEDGAEERRLALATDGRQTATIPLPGERPLQEARFRVRHQLREEVIPLRPQPPLRPALSQPCGAPQSAAQAFVISKPGGSLASVDLHLRPLTQRVVGHLQVYPDAHGRPGDAPLTQTPIPFTLEEDTTPPWGARWLSFSPEAPVALVPGAWWVVLTVTEGEALWSLTDHAAEESSALTPGPTVFRTEETGPWLPIARGIPDGNGAELSRWASTRPHLVPKRSEPLPPPIVKLGRGAATLPVTPDKDGLVVLDARMLQALPPTGGTGTPAPLEVIVESRSSGEVTLSELQVVIPRKETYALFPRS